MTSRIALATVLVLGILLSGTGAGLAVSGLSGDGDAARVQYDPPGEDGTDGSIDGTDGTGDPAAVAEATEQVAVQDEGTLPLTGFVAIPLVIVGVALLTTGVVIRRKARD